jgi:hypothetical protein
MATPKTVQLYKTKKLAGDSGTETFSLKRNDLVVGYLMKVRAGNGATYNSVDAGAEQTIEEAITKIEVRSGSATFKSYSGDHCRKIATYRNGRLPETLLTGIAGGTWAGNSDPLLGVQEMAFPIDFCTKQDPFGNKTNTLFPAPLYDSLDLVLDYDFTISATAGFATGTEYMDLYAVTLPRTDTTNMENKKILVETKKADYTTVASGDQSFDLTLDSNRMLRHLYVDCYEAGIGEGVDVTDLTLKVDGNSDHSIRWGDLQALNASDCRLNYRKLYQWDPTGTDDQIYTKVPAARAIITPYGTADAAGMMVAYDNDKVTVTGDTGEQFEMAITSDVLPAMCVFDFDKDGMQQNMQYCGVKDLDLVITQGGAGGALTVLEQHIAKPWNY